MKNNTILIIGVLALAGVGLYLYSKRQPTAASGGGTAAGGGVGDTLAGLGSGIGSIARGIGSIINDFNGSGNSSQNA